MLSYASLLLLTSAMAQSFFGCQLTPVPGTSSTGTGYIACLQGIDEGEDALACHYSFSGLTGNVTAASWHVGVPPASGNGASVFNFDTIAATSGNVYKHFTGASTDFTMQSGVTFVQQIGSTGAGCGSGTGCYFNVRTTTASEGELRCQGSALSIQYDSLALSFEAVPSIVPAPASNGTARLWHAVVGGRSVWGYWVSFGALTSPIASASLRVGTAAGPSGTGAAMVTFDISGQAGGTDGSFTGVTLFGTPSYPTFSPLFASAFTQHWTYVNVATDNNVNGEIRANFGSDASAVVVNLYVLVIAIAFLCVSYRL